MPPKPEVSGEVVRGDEGVVGAVRNARVQPLRGTAGRGQSVAMGEAVGLSDAADLENERLELSFDGGE